MQNGNSKKILEEGKKHFLFSGAQVLAHSPSTSFHLETGSTSHWDLSDSITSETLFDIGSITKVVATTSIIARLVDIKQLDLKSTLLDFSDSFKNTLYASIKLIEILTHTAGFLSWYPLYKETKPENLTDWYLKNEKTVLKTKGKVEYSDLGLILLGELLNKKFGSIGDLYKKEVQEPLNLKGVSYGPVLTGSIVSTEYDFEKKEVIKGRVFDENAHWLGGKAPHAGLFSSASALGLWATEWLKALKGESKWISKQTAELFTSCHTGNDPMPRGIGFDMKSKIGSSAGTLMSEKTFGHLGYTGCSLWIDPSRELYIILLTNRVHPLRVDNRIRSLRPILHDAILKELGA